MTVCQAILYQQLLDGTQLGSFVAPLFIPSLIDRVTVHHHVISRYQRWLHDVQNNTNDKAWKICLHYFLMWLEWILFGLRIRYSEFMIVPSMNYTLPSDALLGMMLYPAYTYLCPCFLYGYSVSTYGRRAIHTSRMSTNTVNCKIQFSSIH